MRPSRVADLLPAAMFGPIIMVNASRWSCDALVLTAGEIRRISLPDLNFSDILAKTDRYLRAIQEFEISVAKTSADGEQQNEGRYWTAKVAMEQVLTSTHEWMWDRIAGPVLGELGFVSTLADGKTWPRVWWCPTGPLTLLPLHAAGYHEDSTLAQPPTVLDRVVSSYTPTVRALMEARARGPVSTSFPVDDKLLIVTLEDSPGQSSLPNVARERDLLTRLFAGRCTLLNGISATRDAVLSGLAAHRLVHFSCHGTQDLAKPSNGGLILADGTLSVTDLSAGQYSGDFAFMSACKTATGSVTLPDEVITLASAIHYTGYRHVISTMWSVWDDAAADLTQSIYQRLMHEGKFIPDDSAIALHDAVRELRDRADNRHSPSIWSPFIHTGP